MLDVPLQVQKGGFKCARIPTADWGGGGQAFRSYKGVTIVENLKRIGQLVDEYMLGVEKWRTTHRIGVAEYLPEDDVIVIHCTEYSDYEVPVEQCRSARGFTEWIFHLNQKRWFTGEVMKDFVNCLKRALGGLPA